MIKLIVFGSLITEKRWKEKLLFYCTTNIAFSKICTMSLQLSRSQLWALFLSLIFQWVKFSKWTRLRSKEKITYLCLFLLLQKLKKMLFKYGIFQQFSKHILIKLYFRSIFTWTETFHMFKGKYMMFSSYLEILAVFTASFFQSWPPCWA